MKILILANHNYPFLFLANRVPRDQRNLPLLYRPAAEPSGSRAAGSKSMQIDDEEPKVNVDELGDRLRQTALDYNDFRHRDLDSTSEESFGRPVDNAKDIEAQSLQFKLKSVIGMNWSSILSMSVMPIV